MLQAEIIGNIGNDAVIKEFNGKKYVAFNVAHNETDKNGKKTSVWVSVLWYGEGGKLMPYLVKGTQVFVRGRLHAGMYQTKSGEPAVSLNLNASELQLCGGSKSDSQTENGNSTASVPQVQQTQNDNDLPF